MDGSGRVLLAWFPDKMSAATVQGNKIKTLQAANMSRHAEHNFASSVGGSKILGLPSERNEHSSKQKLN